MLQTCYSEENDYEIGVDEVGRGPMLGRVYTAAVILPKDESLFNHCDMKDSKRFHSKKKLEATADYIKQHATAWAITFEDENVIDQINIRQATLKSMRNSITTLLNNNKTDLQITPQQKIQLIIDGNDFKPICYDLYDDSNITYLNHICVEGGDNKYTCIAAASILAKVERDRYIGELCKEHPELSERYKIDSNKGYGAKAHMDGIKKYGITQWHRKTYGICKQYVD